MEGFTHAKENVLLKLINEILLLAFLATDIFCIARGVHGHRNDSFLTASTMTFGVWVVILILFIGTLVYQWTDRGKKVIIDGLSWRLPVIFLANTAYLHFWIHRNLFSVFMFAIFANIAVTNAYYILKTEHHPENIYEELLVHTPISMLHAWSTFLVIDSAFAAFGERTGFEPHGWTKFYVIVALLGLELVSAGYAHATSDGDLIGNITITWVLYGLARRGSYVPFIDSAIWWAALVSVAFVIKSAHGFCLNKYPLYKQQLFGGEILLSSEEV
ncbi:hypothetical protein FRB94_002043 [Tulasnella sp. JGI-2019a]|nr:hypothetical protein FRB93_002844 [Tulasnella sp. JGI-2019a]KAG9004794.1 hypothetical protein FRB94_002043 [Tulasnella sp. JGI-2019a]